jgi:toxin ParE1/3/4
VKIEFSIEARTDLRNIGDWIAQENPVRAISFVDELEAACLSLVDFPERFPVFKRLPEGSLRRKVHGHYLIFYLVQAERVDVARILHGAQDYSELF